MPITFRNYDNAVNFAGDYTAVRDFLLRQERSDFSYGRWDWMVTHSMLDVEALGKIGLWEDEGRLVALAAFDTQPGTGYFCVDADYADLKREVFHYAARNLGKNGHYTAMITDGDADMQQIAADAGFVATQHREMDAVYCEEGTPYVLPEGFAITSMADTFDLMKYEQVLYKGFNHEETEGPFSQDKADAACAHGAMVRPNVDLNLKVAVVAPSGDFVAYCGMRYDPAVDFAIVEPVATDPAYRRMGLGRAAVLEGIRRCKALGAERAFVGSSQQFYYSIGFRPVQTATGWRRADAMD